jgi:short-subunit dehydrogenase
MGRTSRFWREKCVIITGASGGIGRALAEYLSTCGATLGLVARRTNVLAEVAESVASRGAKVGLAGADVVDCHATWAAVRALESQLGVCDVLVACAGVYHKTIVTQFNPDEANQVIATNVQGVINAFGAVLPGMTERRRGHLAAVASIAGLLGLPGAGAYSASKAAVITLLESLRVDLYPLGIKVTTICPGHVDTPMLSEQERAHRSGVLSADQTARRIAKAVERGLPEIWFPKTTWISARFARLLPFSLYRLIVSKYPQMEEPQGPS